MTAAGRATDRPTDGPTPDAIMALGTGFWGSRTLLSAVELGLLTRSPPSTRTRPS